ncbi:repetitive organellar protein [Carassius gibelio]|uniref:repetitive organellar protein n=1 Tax=Carassius gibelio TaxID=101364 RepID=UPI002277C4A5|nr:repetitive organellar protein [Carassius gibelio]XP_052431799.1 repetitive organellar protein [Carassius gibelio]XP_052431800.1 repetitive organellar protein [Carassius gibelio]
MMSTRGKSEGCRICGSDLQGNQRRWLYAGQNRKGTQPQTPTDFSSKGSLPRSAQSSPWGSTLSLSSSRSLSKSRGVLTPTKGIDLLCVLTHILEQPVPRGSGQGEFVCGKCVSVLERVFKFDTVIARVRVLSSERLQKLTQERDKIRRWVRSMYDQHHPSTSRRNGSSSEDERDQKDSVGEGYREMLRDNMALSEYEWWSEKAESCPYYRTTGKRCQKGKLCECCDSLRVSDSDYESVCGIPRNLPDQAFTSLGLSREKSCSMPLHWSKTASVRSSPASLSGSCHSLQSRSRATSVHSLDSLDGNDLFDWPEEHSAIIDTVFKELRRIEGKPVRSPSGSRIPVLHRGDVQNGKDEMGLKAGLVKVLNFEDGDNGTEDEFEEENDDIMTELKDDFMPLQREASAGKMHHAVKQLREQLVQAQARIRTLEAQLRDTNKPTTDAPAKQLKSPQVTSLKNKNDLIESLSQSLHSRENVIQECVILIQKLCAELGLESQDSDKLLKKLASAVTDTRTEREAVLEAELSEASEREKALEKQLQAMRDAGRERDRDIITLNTVLQCNQDVINHLHVELAERDRAQQEMMKEWEVWKERDSALTALVKENKDYISQLKEALESSRRDVQALSDSLIGRGLEGGGAEAGLVNQLREKEALLAASFRDREELSASMLQEISRLSSALTNTESIIMDQRENHKQAITALSEQLKNTLKELREKTKEKKEAELGWKKENKERASEEGKLRDNLQKRDKLIEQVLLELEERDGVLTELQQNISSQLGPRTALKHTL